MFFYYNFSIYFIEYTVHNQNLSDEVRTVI